MTIDQLGMTTIKHLRSIHDLKSYRNACRIVGKLKPYIHETFYNKEKVVYLNRDGRELIGSSHEVKKSGQIEHTLLRNEAFVYFNCPLDWKPEREFVVNLPVENKLDFIVSGVNVVNKKKVVCDASFSRNGYLHIVEIDNKRAMADNKTKLDTYKEIFPHLKQIYNQIPTLYFFTTTQQRKKKIEAWMLERNIRGEVKIYSEL
ncbi:hypothetical protein [Peribacillus kribbensis]|uniref:hypothetical protein n=1 Tax=Peribacillus kribbensis TaxID=356658 RepID=UPI0012DE5343|nr:hypothetical protein [Peribacillus kribbensis]